ncbi:MAG: hypothetical protein JXA42_13060, partial [Anaerolineales bacterium]|nr:hypothetical protein [Anaerolineales bacterium]
MRIKKFLGFLGPVLFMPVLLLGILMALIAAGSSQAAPSEELHVCSSCDYTTIQAAVDVADPDSTIKVAAGIYTDVHTFLHWGTPLTQVVYINKSLTIEGGYTTNNWLTPNPAANPTVLDAEGEGRVFWIFDDTITNIT